MTTRLPTAKRLWASLFLATALFAQALAAAHHHGFEPGEPETSRAEEAPSVGDGCDCPGHSVPKPDAPVQDDDCSGHSGACSHEDGTGFCECACHARGVEQLSTAPASQPAPRQPLALPADDFAPDGIPAGVFHPPKTLS